jgi:hypothetical protein
VSGSASPREVIERLIQGISKGRWQELDELYAEDAVVEYPFALPSGPARLAGRSAPFLTGGSGSITLSGCLP